MAKLQQQRYNWLHLAILILAIIVGYSKIFQAGFMNWDDLDYVFNTPDINSGLTLQNFKNWFTKNYLGNYQPLPVMSYALDHAIGGKDPLVYHIHSLVWHAVATILVYILFSRLQENKWVAFFVALLFAIHPVQTESVSWIAARNKSMNAVFYFIAIYFYLDYLDSKQWKKLVFVTLFGLLAYLCKATALALPLALFAVDIWLNRSLTHKKIWLEKLPLILVGIPVAYITLSAQKEVTFLQHHGEFGWNNIVFAGYALVQYAVHLVFPIQLSVLYPYPKTVNALHYIFLLIALCSAVFMIIAFKKGWRIWAGGILFFIVNLLPVLQLVQFGETIMANRYLYIACLGLWYPLVSSLFKLFEKKNLSSPILIAGCVSLLFLTMTFSRNKIWLNEINFWNAVLDKFPESSVAHYSIGGAFMKLGDLNNAELHMNKAVEYDPLNYKAWRNKGSLHLRQSRAKEALLALNRSLEIYPYSKAYFTRAMLYHSQQQFELTISDLEKVIQQEPENARAYYIKGDCEEQLGKNSLAMNDYDRAVSVDSKEPLFLIRRGLLKAKSGDTRAALNDLDQAVAINPANGESYYYRAMMRYGLKMNPCDDLRTAYKNGYKQAGDVIAKICR